MGLSGHVTPFVRRLPKAKFRAMSHGRRRRSALPMRRSSGDARKERSLRGTVLFRIESRLPMGEMTVVDVGGVG